MKQRRLTTPAYLIMATIMACGNLVLAERAPRGSGAAAVIGSTLQITGTEFDDSCVVTSISGNRIRVILNRTSYRFPAETIDEIEFTAGEGNDSFTNRTSLMATVEGGPGDDFLKSTDGVAMFFGGTGDDMLFGGPEDDILCGGSDDDIVFGNSGNDFISGDASGPSSDDGSDLEDIIEMMVTGVTDAQQVGDQAFAKGRFVQIGVNERGTFGAEGANLPEGYVDTVGENRAGFGDLVGFVADSGKDGFEDGGYDGDFFTPGFPEEGFTVQFNGENYSNNRAFSTDFQVPGMITSTSNTTRSEIVWQGSVNGLGVQRKIRVYPDGLFIELEVELTNQTEEDLSEVYFMNNVDPDNDQTLHGDFATFNQIVSQGDSDPDNISLVTAQQGESGAAMSGGTEESGSAISLVAFDPRARVSFGGFNNRIASQVYSGTGLSSTVGDFDFSDTAISLAFNVGDLAPGESTTVVYYYSLDPTGIDISDITDQDNDCSDGGEPGDDIIYGESGDDIISSDDGKDLVFGGSGDDTIETGNGADRAYGNSGNDVIETGDDNDKAFGGAGKDTIRGGNGNDLLNGGSKNDMLYGENGDDRILGAAGDDLLDGGAGTDVLVGGPGNDTEVD